jgi:hypothetical protein
MLKYLQRVMNPIYKNYKCETLPLAIVSFEIKRQKIGDEHL